MIEKLKKTLPENCYNLLKYHFVENRRVKYSKENIIDFLRLQADIDYRLAPGDVKYWVDALKEAKNVL